MITMHWVLLLLILGVFYLSGAVTLAALALWAYKSRLDSGDVSE